MASLLDAVKADTRNNQNMCRHYAALPEDIRADLDQLIDQEQLTYLSTKLDEIGYDFPENALSKHRRGACRCKRGRAS